MDFKFNTLFCILLLAFTHYSYSACSKDDVEFYLDKGFTQEQITQLCATSEGSSVPDYKPYQQQVIIYSEGEAPGIKDGFTQKEREAIKNLKLGADVKGLTIDQDYIKFISKVCVAVQEGKDRANRYRTCPDINVEVDRIGLSVSASGKTFGLFGERIIEIQGNIKRTLKEGAADNFPPKFRERLLQSYSWKTRKPEMNLPIRGDYSVTKLYDALTTLSKESADSTTLAQKEENKDEDDVKPETINEPENEGEKKKRWWNPFD